MTVSIKQINIIAFGHFENLVIDFDEGFNLIYGNNESGKSTIASFIEGILYGFDEGVRVRKFNDKQKIYQPLGSYKYAGFAIFNKDGIAYRVSRNFATGEYEIYDLDTKIVVEAQESRLTYPGEFLLGIDYDLYKNLISSYQNQDTSPKARQKIREVLTTKVDYSFSATKAIENLDKLYREIGTDRAYTKPYMATKTEIDDLSREINDLAALRKSYYSDFKNLDKNRLQIKNKTDQLRKLKADRDSYRKNIAHQNLEDQIKYQNQLNLVKQNLADLGYVEGEALSKPPKGYVNEIIFISLGVILTLICIYYRKFILIPIAILAPLLILIYLNTNKNLPTDTADKKYSDYDKFLKLSYEKEKLEEVLRVLENQDKTTDRANMERLASIDIKAVEDKIETLENDLEELRSINISLEKNLASAEEKLAKEVILIEKRAGLSEKLAQMEEEKQAIELAIATINEIISENHGQSDAFEREVSAMVKAISKGAYEDISYDADLKPRIGRSDGSTIDIDQLSRGMVDQLSFAMKYQANTRLNENFMVFDDAFINYDTDRLRLALLFLLDIAVDRQIIYLTCHRREREILRSEDIYYNEINLEEL